MSVNSSASSGYEISYTGMGKDMVTEKSKEWTDTSRLDGIMSVGFAGSIDPDLGFGETCLVESVGTPEGERRYEADDRLLGLLLEEKAMRVADLLTLEEAASTVEEKVKLANEYSAQMIDQETYWWAEFAELEDLPFVGIRVIYDELDQELPPSNVYDERTGRISVSAAARWLLGEPSRLFSLPRLGVNSLLARRNLANAVSNSLQVLTGVN